jgi:hypothetical protein
VPSVLEETTTQELDRRHVLRRVDDWVDRVTGLYSDICSWLPVGWTAHQRDTVRMHEPLMLNFNVPARDLPVLELSSGERSARLEPRGLWIIGANGRLDLFANSGHHIIIDAAENLQPPQWQIAPFADRQRLKPLDVGTFRTVL